MSRATIYTDPFSGIEMLCLERGEQICGVSYDPRKTNLPIPWTGACPHCHAGRHPSLPMQARWEIVFLLSRTKCRDYITY
jgi:hypothetical protein